MQRPNVVVVGGGVIGLCAARALRRRGANVTLLERQDVGAGSSFGNAGLVSPSHVVPLAAPGLVWLGLKWMFNPESPLYIKPRLDGGLLAWLWRFRAACSVPRMERSLPVLRALTDASRQLYETLARELDDFGFERNGVLMMACSERGRHGNAHEAELAARVGITTEALDGAGLAAHEPDLRFRDGVSGVLYRDDAHLQPARLVAALARAAAAEGVRLVKARALHHFERAGDRVTHLVIDGAADGDELQADEFVLAAGAWSAKLARSAGVSLSLEAGKGYSLTFAEQPRRVRTPMIFTEARVAMTPMGDQLRLGGTMELAGLDTSINQRRVEAIPRALPRYLEGFTLAPPAEAAIWGGLRPCTPDGLPYIGRARGLSNLVIATGHAMLGVTLAPITGELVAQVIAGEPPVIDLAPLDPARYA